MDADTKQTEADLYGLGLLGYANNTAAKNRLNEQFLVPPFSTFNTRDDFWQERRRCWLALGIQSEVGREGKLTYAMPENVREAVGATSMGQTSVFDPVLCEIAVKWWCPPGGVVLDPFAGGSVRGIVASVLGRKYYGIELRPEQVAANVAQLGPSTCGKWKPKWVVGNSAVMLDKAPAADFLFSCPPYGSLERYSDDPTDLSTMRYPAFVQAYTDIIQQAAARLRPDRFAVWVVASFREDGYLRDLPGDTVRAFELAGCRWYNDITLWNNVGTGRIRAGNHFRKGNRKVVKLHQNVLVFVKGDPAVAAAGIPIDDAPPVREEERW